MRMFIFPIFVAVSTLAACGGSSGGAAVPEPGANPGANDGGPVPVVDGAASVVDSATPTVVDGSMKTDAGVDRRIDPIELGRTWTYDVSIIGVYPMCKAGSSTGRVLGKKVVAGKQAFQVQSFCPGAGTSSYAVDGDKVELYLDNAWILALDAPVAEGHTWTDGVETYAWEKVGELTVPAGTYDDCWTVRPQSGSSYSTFCRGVGPVLWHYVDFLGNGYDATLTATAP